MPASNRGNMLLVSNYVSDTAYALWLMEHFWVTLAKLGQKSAMQSFLAYPSIKTIPESIKNAGIETVELTIPWQTPYEESKVREFVQKNGISTIYFTDQPFFNPKYAKLRSMGVNKIVVHDHTPGDRPPIRGLKGAIKSIRNSFTRNTADAVFCVSELMRQRNINNARVPARKCITIQNGMPPVTFNKTRAEVRAELGIAEDKIVAMTSGRAHAYKRIDLVIRSVYELKKLDPDNNVLFLFAGDGPDMQELTDLCKTLGIEEQFRLLGFRRDVKDLLGAADFAIHAALGEAFSLSITEYMGAGLPVLVPDIPSVSQAIDHGKNGFVYAKDSPEDIANYASKLAQDAALRKQLGDQAKQDSLSKYSMDQCTETLIKIANTVIIENRLP